MFESAIRISIYARRGCLRSGPSWQLLKCQFEVQNRLSLHAICTHLSRVMMSENKGVPRPNSLNLVVYLPLFWTTHKQMKQQTDGYFMDDRLSFIVCRRDLAVNASLQPHFVFFGGRGYFFDSDRQKWSVVRPLSNECPSPLWREPCLLWRLCRRVLGRPQHGRRQRMSQFSVSGIP